MLVSFPAAGPIANALENDSALGDKFKTGHFKETDFIQKLASAFANTTYENPQRSQQAVAKTMLAAGAMPGKLDTNFEAIQAFDASLRRIGKADAGMR